MENDNLPPNPADERESMLLPPPRNGSGVDTPFAAASALASLRDPNAPLVPPRSQADEPEDLDPAATIAAVRSENRRAPRSASKRLVVAALVLAPLSVLLLLGAIFGGTIGGWILLVVGVVGMPAVIVGYLIYLFWSAATSPVIIPLDQVSDRPSPAD